MLLAFYYGQDNELTCSYYTNNLFNRTNMATDKTIIALYDFSEKKYIKLPEDEKTIKAIENLFKVNKK